MAELAFPTALAGWSEIDPRDARERLKNWEHFSKDGMTRSVSVKMTWEWAQLDFEEAFSQVREFDLSVEGLAFAAENDQQIQAIKQWVEGGGMAADLRSVSNGFPINTAEAIGELNISFALGWARHDLKAAWEFIEPTWLLHNRRPL